MSPDIFLPFITGFDKSSAKSVISSILTVISLCLLSTTFKYLLISSSFNMPSSDVALKGFLLSSSLRLKL